MAREERDYSHRSLLDKLGVKRDHRIYIRAIPSALHDELDAVLERPCSRRLTGAFDLIFVHVERHADLDDLDRLAAHLTRPVGCGFFIPKARALRRATARCEPRGLPRG